MDIERVETWILGIAVAIICAAYLPDCGRIAHGQGRVADVVQPVPMSTPLDADNGLMLARLCAHEAGWSTRDCDGIFGVLENLRQIRERREARPRELVHAISWYSPRFFGGMTSRSPMFRFLEPGGGRSWRHLLARARELVAGARPRCDTLPDHWGSRTHPVDRARAARAIAAGYWRDADCGDTRNRFFVDLRR